jgi:acyl transferase domain-containing protein
VAAALEAQGVFHKFLRVEVAYHSPQMDPLRAELAECLAGLAPSEPKAPLYSTAYGAEVPGSSWDAEYWWVNVRESVRFADAMRELLDAGYTSFLEIGPHPVLGASIKECAMALEKRVTCHLSLRRKDPERRTLLTSLAELYCRGQKINWSALARGTGAFLPAPAYPWQRSVHWQEAERTRLERLGSPGPVYLQTPSAGPAVSWEVEINRHYFPFLFDHGVQNQTVFAGMGLRGHGLRGGGAHAGPPRL